MYRAGMRSGMWGSSHLSWFDFRDFLFGSKQDKVLFKASRGCCSSPALTARQFS